MCELLPYVTNMGEVACFYKSVSALFRWVIVCVHMPLSVTGTVYVCTLQFSYSDLLT